jgi:hypothetical protein
MVNLRRRSLVGCVANGAQTVNAWRVLVVTLKERNHSETGGNFEGKKPRRNWW